MTSVMIPVTASDEASEGTAPCGCCVAPPDAAQAEGRRQALAALEARREAVERRLAGLG
jgi:hypothetical protein